jgi:hypothetical protein
MGADLVDGVLRGVVVAVGHGRGVRAVVVIDKVENRNAPLLEGKMIVLDSEVVGREGGGVVGVFGCGGEEVPWGGWVRR